MMSLIPTLGHATVALAVALMLPLLGRVPKVGGIRAQGRDESPQRKLILDVIKARPGIPVGELLASVSMGWGTLYYHLRKMRKAEMIQIVVSGRRRLIYPSAMPVAGAEASADSILWGETARKIASRIAQGPFTSVSALSEELGESPRVVYYHVKRLIQAGLVEAQRVRGTRDLRATPALLARFAPEEAPAEAAGLAVHGKRL